MYKHIRKTMRTKTPERKALRITRLREWKAQSVTERIERPSNLVLARNLGYKPKQGVILVRQRILRAQARRPTIRAGRRPRHFGQKKNLKQSHQWTAELRAQKKHKNTEVLNSYFVDQDAKYRWFEVILLDRTHPAVLADKQYKTVVLKRGRATRGLTSAGRKSRGLRSKGMGSEKLRPSRGANLKRRRKI